MDRFSVTDADFAERRRKKRERPVMPDEELIAYYKVRWRKKRREKSAHRVHAPLQWVWKEQIINDSEYAFKRVEGLRAGKYRWKLIAVLKFTLDGPSEIEIDRWTSNK